jgi:hypothetical protein
MTDAHERLLNALLGLSGRLVTFMGHVRARPGPVPDFFAMGTLTTAETNLTGVPEGDRVLIAIGDARISIVVADITDQRLASDAERVVAADHVGRDCGCYIVETGYSILLFQDSERHSGL